VVGGSSKTGFTFFDFSHSEFFFTSARGTVSSEHFVVFSLFFSNLSFEVIEETFDVGEWGTESDLFFDLGKEVTEVSGLEGTELFVSLETEGAGNEANEE